MPCSREAALPYAKWSPISRPLIARRPRYALRALLQRNCSRRLQAFLQSVAFSLLLTVSRATRTAAFSVLALTNCKQQGRAAVKLSRFLARTHQERLHSKFWQPRSAVSTAAHSVLALTNCKQVSQACTFYKAPQFTLLLTAGRNWIWQTVNQA